MFRESTAKVKQSHGARHALIPGRSGKFFRYLVALLVLPALAIAGWSGVSLGQSPARAHQKPIVSTTQPSSGFALSQPLNLVALQPILKLQAAQQANNQLVWHQAQVAQLMQAVARNAASNRPRWLNTSGVFAINGRIPYDFGLWMRVHDCEQPDSWHAGGHFGNGLPAGGNGLGFSLYAWAMGVRMAAQMGVILPASGWAASIDQQMQLAQAVLDITGKGPDCLARVR